MLHKPGVTQNLARFVVTTRWDDVPEPVRHDAKRALMNIVAVALAGCREESLEILLRSLAAFCGPQQATVIGRRERLDALSAAFLNAAGMNMPSFCDTHLRTVIHPTSPIAPGLFALSELRTVSGREFLLAFVLGAEIECRIGNAISPGHYARGWHITATCGVFGAAAAAGKVLALDEQKMISALGAAATQSSGLCECLGSPAKSLGVGNAARNGLWSALLADQGLQGPVEPIAGVQGFINALGQEPDWSAFSDGLGETWELRQNALKPYPCGVVLHPVIDCVLDWRRAHPAETVERVVVRGHPLLALRADRPQVASGREAQVSVQHVVAAALLRGRASLQEFSDACVNDPAVLAMRGKVEVLRDESIDPVAAAVEITAGGGKRYDIATEAARGSASNPMSDRDLEEKFRACAEGWQGGYDAAPLIDAMWNLDRSDEVAKVLTLLVPGH